MNELIGRTIVGTRAMTGTEMEYLDWWGQIEILVLDDGTELVPVQDEEGNGGGTFWHCGAGEFAQDAS